MSTLSPQAQAIISTFGSRTGVKQDHANNLQAVIASSPALIDQINDAVAQGHLQQIMPLTNPNAGGEYNGARKEMRLPLTVLATPPPGQAFNAGEVAFVLGHELQHGFNHAATVQAYQDFTKEATQAATTDHNYTDEISKLISTNRRDEAAAEIAGWNAIVGMVATSKQNPSLQDVFNAQPGRMSDFIDRSQTPPYAYSLKPNLALNQDLTMSLTPSNVEAMGQNYFDKKARALGGRVGLGHHGNSDYTNYYATWPVGMATRLERQHNPRPSMLLDLSKLGLSEQLLEENGIDLGNNQQPMAYLDIGTNPPRSGLFQHTITSHRHSSPVAAQVLEADLAHNHGDTQVERPPVTRASSSPLRNGPADLNHPDHPMLQQIREGVRRVDDGIGKPYDEASERMSRCLLVQCREAGLRRVDHVVMGTNGTNVFAVEGQLKDPAHLRTHVATGQAIRTPVEQSDERLLAANHAGARQQESAQQRELARGPDDPGRSGPVMQM